MRLLMMGTGAFAVPTFVSLLESEHEVLALVTRPVPPAHGRTKTPPNPMRDLAEQRGLRVLQPEDVNAEASRQELAALHADLFVACDYGQILSAQTLAIPPLGAINLHASLLPKYRGAAPINWALYHGERETGVTVFHITPKVDSGPILAQEATPIDPSEDAIRLERRLSQLGVGAVRRSIERLAAWDRQSPLGAAQDPRSATKAPRLKKEHGFVDWTRSAQQIANQVRALKPWPSTYTVLRRPEGDELRLILDQVSVVEEAAGTSGPGEVVQVDKRRLLVATGNGLLSIERIQPAGKRCMGTDEFLRGHAIQPGQNLASPADT